MRTFDPDRTDVNGKLIWQVCERKAADRWDSAMSKGSVYAAGRAATGCGQEVPDSITERAEASQDSQDVHGGIRMQL